MTTRAGGASTGRFAGLNLRHGLGDHAADVETNRSLLRAACGAEPVWLDQVHGTRVARLTLADLAPGAPVPMADASVTRVPGIACAVQVADCLPVLFKAPGAAAVGAAHAGWRGLAAGVLEATLEAVCEAGGCAPAEVQVWLGASIGPRRFEVGPDVLAAFGSNGDDDRSPIDVPRFVAHAPGKWMANLPLLARDRLRAAGAREIGGENGCTAEDASRFFSFRRDGVTGRMAALIWIERDG